MVPYSVDSPNGAGRQQMAQCLMWLTLEEVRHQFCSTVLMIAVFFFSYACHEP